MSDPIKHECGVVLIAKDNGQDSIIIDCPYCNKNHEMVKLVGKANNEKNKK